MLAFEDNSEEIMSLPRTGNVELTKEEWDELVALRNAINYNPHTVSPDKMEKFSELMVRSIREMGG